VYRVSGSDVDLLTSIWNVVWSLAMLI
jgi:hypothetical protein